MKKAVKYKSLTLITCTHVIRKKFVNNQNLKSRLHCIDKIAYHRIKCCINFNIESTSNLGFDFTALFHLCFFVALNIHFITM